MLAAPRFLINGYHALIVVTTPTGMGVTRRNFGRTYILDNSANSSVVVMTPAFPPPAQPWPAPLTPGLSANPTATVTR